MTYYLYHIPGKKVGVTRDLEERVVKQQGYDHHEFDILLKSDDIEFISNMEIAYQLKHGYRVDEIPYNKLKFNNKEMNINITEQTTTFPCPVNKLKGQLMDNKGMSWETDHGPCLITDKSIEWIMKNVVTSKYNTERCYVYNKAMARWFDNNDAHTTRTGGLAPDCGPNERQLNIQEALEGDYSQFDLIREWAHDRGLYTNGDPKTQALKLAEEVGETCRAILKNDRPEIIDGIGDCVVVLTNLAELNGTTIEECIERAYNEIKDRTGKMSNGTFKKD
jgi:NTP pyrophosphatase (non-canonical NTP hydrolase)